MYQDSLFEVNWVDEIPDFESSILRASVYLQIRSA